MAGHLSISTRKLLAQESGPKTPGTMLETGGCKRDARDFASTIIAL
jgi:hypothetical protein